MISCQVTSFVLPTILLSNFYGSKGLQLFKKVHDNHDVDDVDVDVDSLTFKASVDDDAVKTSYIENKTRRNKIALANKDDTAGQQQRSQAENLLRRYSKNRFTERLRC